MKEYHHAFITAATLFYSAEKAGRAMLSMTNDYGGAFVYYLEPVPKWTDFAQILEKCPNEHVLTFIFQNS